MILTVTLIAKLSRLLLLFLQTLVSVTNVNQAYVKRTVSHEFNFNTHCHWQAVLSTWQTPALETNINHVKRTVFGN
jgi:hypothetical protein